MIKRVWLQSEKAAEKCWVDQQCVVINLQNPDLLPIILIDFHMFDQQSEFRLKWLVSDGYPFPQPRQLFVILHENEVR
jgi:hypothetical protein